MRTTVPVTRRLRYRAAGGRVATLSTHAVRDVVWRLAVAAGLGAAGLTPHRF
jgi:hypothetical protein